MYVEVMCIMWFVRIAILDIRCSSVWFGGLMFRYASTREVSMSKHVCGVSDAWSDLMWSNDSHMYRIAPFTFCVSFTMRSMSVIDVFVGLVLL